MNNPIHTKAKQSLKNLLVLGSTFMVTCGMASFYALAATTGDYIAIPPFITQNTGKPNVIISLDISGSMKAVAYRDTGAGDWKTGLHDDFDPTVSYFGYFDIGPAGSINQKNYIYDPVNGLFKKDAISGQWSGNFLNWLAMRRFDVVRQVLVGGKIRDRNGESLTIAGESGTWYIREGQNEPLDYSFRKSDAGGSTYTPYPDSQEFTIANGAITPTTVADAFVTVLGNKMEIGSVTMDWAVGDPWKTISFANTYTDPVVIATSVSYKGSDPVNARVRNVTASNFEIRLQEWDYLDETHTTEEIIYIVAEKGQNSIVVKDGTGTNVTVNFVAGEISTNAVAASSFFTELFGYTFSTKPLVFAGVSSYNGSSAVSTRVKDVTQSQFKVAMTEEEANDQSHIAEDIHYLAILPITGVEQSGNVAVEIKSVGKVVNNAWYTINFDTTFSGTPPIALSMQTTDGIDPSNLRYGNALRTGTQVDVQVDEETSGDSETGHANEEVAYMAVNGTGFNIKVAVKDTEPTGILQDNAGGMRFGMAVYNYDHTRASTNIYNGNLVNGGTFHPCYPDTSLPVSNQTNYDICRESHVKAPLQNLIDVIEDHPLIWGTTPTAEMLHEIYGYVGQINHNTSQTYSSFNHPYWYDNGTEQDSTSYPSYEISNAWDPYYYDEYSAKLECSKTFVLHFTDGEPFTDWDTGVDPTTIKGETITDGQAFSGTPAEVIPSDREMLDDVAYMLRKKDCRGDIDEHQEIISYYVFAALGEGEINDQSARKMREAAAVGGFIDVDGDHLPDGPTPTESPHPANFQTYFQTFLNGGSCSTDGEWDADGDCNPDTFYVANNGYELINELTAAFQSILRRASSGGAASVIAASSSGEGATYQALFRPSHVDGAFNVKWTGDIHALFVDSAGYIREDDGDKVLEDYASDNIINMCFNSAAQEVRVNLAASEADIPTSTEFSSCAISEFNKTLFDLNYLWSGGQILADITDIQATSQRSYASALPGRHILTWLDTDNDGVVDVGEQKEFSTATFNDTNEGYLLASDNAEADKIVDFIRGKDQTGYRSREVSGGKTWRLGDVIYSTPTIVTKPAEAIDLIYKDATYSAFVKQYRDRRHMVYVGGNDGMLHAFNGGWYDAASKKFEDSPSSASVDYGLGSELWAYVPMNILPHLKYLTDPGYGLQVANHVYYVDMKPRIFDAQIFANDTTHPNGWGTILVGGMRFGGGSIDITVDPDDPVPDIRTLRSSLFILDITDPEQAPKLMLEFSHPNLGFTTSSPAPFKFNGNWYLMVGSGPDANQAGLQAGKSTQAANLFLFNLGDSNPLNTPTAPVLETGFGTSGILTLTDSNSFISDLVAVDYDLDASADAVYFGTVEGIAAPWGGKLYRVEMDDPTLAISTWTADLLLNPGKPFTVKPAIGFDDEKNRWVFVGSGRYLTSNDAPDTSDQLYFGIKEPRNTSGTFTWATIPSASPFTGTTAKIVDVSNATVEEVTFELTGVSDMELPNPASFYNLENLMLGYSDATKYRNGWFRTFTGGDRIIGEAALLGETLTHTSYKPTSNACEAAGTAFLHAVNFTTGTAGNVAILGISGTDSDGDGNYELITGINIGVAPALTPSLHTGEGYTNSSDAKAFIQTSTGKISTIDQNNATGVSSGEQSWREIR